MRTQPITKTFTGILVFLLSFIFAQGICVKTTLAKDTTSNKQKAAALNQKQTAERQKEILEGATAVIQGTQNALKALDEGNKKDALAALENVDGKLDVILAREPELALAPAGVEVGTYDLLADVDDVKALRKEIERALDKGRVQEARHLIRNLASETVISVTNIPLVTYPEAIGQAVRFIDEGKIDKAKMTLQTALNTLVVTDTVIPLPVTNAEAMLKEAEALAEKTDRNKTENTRLSNLLKDTREELQRAQALGYGSKKDFKNLYEQLDAIEDQTEGGQSGTGFFDKIKSYLKDTVASSQHTGPASKVE